MRREKKGEREKGWGQSCSSRTHDDLRGEQFYKRVFQNFKNIKQIFMPFQPLRTTTSPSAPRRRGLFGRRAGSPAGRASPCARGTLSTRGAIQYINKCDKKDTGVIEI